MSARDDLLLVGGALAAQARLSVDPPRPHGWSEDLPSPNLGDHDAAVRLSLGAKAALEAAALVDVDPGPVIEAIRHLDVQVGLLPAPVDSLLAVGDLAGGSVTVIDTFADALAQLREDVQVAVAVQSGYVALGDLLRGLLRDFEGADTDTARRIAARISTGLADADRAIRTARNEMEVGDGEG